MLYSVDGKCRKIGRHCLCLVFQAYERCALYKNTVYYVNKLCPFTKMCIYILMYIAHIHSHRSRVTFYAADTGLAAGLMCMSTDRRRVSSAHSL